MNQPTNAEQLDFWRGEFGHHYMARNGATPEQLRPIVALWARILRCMESSPPESILEVGANIGRNLRALRTLTPARLLAVEPNQEARAILLQDKVVEPSDVWDGTAAALPLPDGLCDMAFTSTVLIHIHPDALEQSYREIYRVTRRYIVCIEYFADKLEMVPYRDNLNKLFKRDFGGYWLDLFPNLQVLDYGFAWKRLTKLDNFTWWVFEKRN
ncbi:MAG: methyltransferase domain-containing protein [Magnetococcales bacterium]|nr:methyltransferase domain-containing protein [Magnetococcales bacterium]